MQRLCLIGGLALAVAAAGCGSATEPRGVAPIGRGTQYRPASLSQAVAAARPGLECGRRRAAHWVHVELFARGKVMILPAGIGVAPSRRRDGAYVRGGRCRDPLLDGLAKAAIEAVARLATANGHPVDTPPEASLELAASDASTGGGGPSPLVFAAPAVLLFAGLAIAGRVARRRESAQSPPQQPQSG